MARKEEAPNMVERFAEFKELKNIDKTTMISVLEESFRNVLAKMFGTDENLDVIMNPDKGDVQIFQNLEVVPDGEVTNPNLQISLTDARADDDPDVEIGEEHTKEIFFADFGRRAILNLRQTLQSKILDLQKEAVYAKFKELEGELVSGEVYQTWSRETLLLDDEKNELLLPKSESIPGDFFRKGETVLAVIANVDNKNNNPKITVSRTNEAFLRRLFEREVPEIVDGLISIRAVARIPGERAKIAVAVDFILEFVEIDVFVDFFGGVAVNVNHIAGEHGCEFDVKTALTDCERNFFGVKEHFGLLLFFVEVDV